ncbi:MAG: CHRD domain-containing protein, partial [Bacteroidetes bacterium]|nr:CHRD domain-containing protein [Bacteroidota bacterium]
TYASGKNQTVPVQTNGYGALKLELLGSKLRLSGSFDDLNGDFNPNAAGGVHLHGASAGTNGGIEVGLTTMLDGDLKGGVFWADSNLYDLTEPQITALMAGDLYLN